MNMEKIYEETYYASNSLQIEKYLKSIIENEEKPSAWLLEKIYPERDTKLLFEQTLREMGYVSIQRAANRLESLIKKLTQSHSSSKTEDLINPDKIAEKAVKQLIQEGSPHNPQNLEYNSKKPQIPFTTIETDGDTTKTDKSYWISGVLYLLSNIDFYMKGLYEAISRWLNRLIP